MERDREARHVDIEEAQDEAKKSAEKHREDNAHESQRGREEGSDRERKDRSGG